MLEPEGGGLRNFARRSVLAWSAASAFVLVLGATALATSRTSTSRQGPAGLIAYLHQGHDGRELFVMRSDGTQHRRLVDGNVRMFAWSRGGKKIAYLRGRPESVYADLYVMNADGTGKRMVVRHLGREGGEAEIISWLAWSPTGTRIAFMSNRSALSQPAGFRRELAAFDFGLYAVDVDGTDLRYQTENRPGDIRSQDWSSDGKRFVLFSWSDTIYTIDASGGSFRPVYTAPFPFVLDDVSWTPDGRRILFSEHASERDIPSRADISLIDADGRHRIVLSRGRRDAEQTCSPDGRRIALVRRVGTAPGVDEYDYRLRSQIYVVDTSGRRLHRLAGTGPIINRGPGEGRPTYAWSPDGGKIVYSSAPGPRVDQQELYVVNVNGTGKRRLTHNASHDVAPAWQPPPRA